MLLRNIKHMYSFPVKSIAPKNLPKQKTLILHRYIRCNAWRPRIQAHTETFHIATFKETRVHDKIYNMKSYQGRVWQAIWEIHWN